MSQSALRITPNADAWSYGTRIVQRTDAGRVLVNGTQYSVTTSRHQTLAQRHLAELGLLDNAVTVRGVPRGAVDLRPYAA
jgi:hypothetical protein